MKRDDYLFQLAQRAFICALFMPLIFHSLCRMGYTWWSDLPEGATKWIASAAMFGLTIVSGYGQFRIPFGLYPTRNGALAVWIALLITHLLGAWNYVDGDSIEQNMRFMAIGGIAMLVSSVFAWRMRKTADVKY